MLQRTCTPSARDSGTPRSQDSDAASRAEVAKEARDLAVLKRSIQELASLVGPFWRWGDGEGGYVRQQIEDAFRTRGLVALPPTEPKSYAKKPIPGNLRRQVFERDAYRCRHCGGWENLQADHVYPEALGGQATLDNLQTLCGSCNNRKGATV